MIAVLGVLGVVFLLMLVGFLIYLIYMGSCHREPTTAAANEAANQTATKTTPLDLSIQKTIPGADLGEKSVENLADLSRKTVEKQAGKASEPLQSAPKSNISTPVRTNSPAGRGRATKEPILAIANKSLTSFKSMSSNNTVESSASKAISTRSSLEVQRKELALKKKRAKPRTTAKTPEAK